MTYRLGQMSIERLDGVDPRLVRCVRRAIEISDQDFSVFEGLRTLERQKELFARGASRTLDSYHLPDAKGVGHAVDLVPFIGGRVQWQDVPCLVIARSMLFAAKEFGVPVTWGGVWETPLAELDPDDLAGEVDRYVDSFRAHTGRSPLVDRPHFQVPRSS
ncbi:MAG TPA: M15 family metallopeptidase [Gaiellaceae bacterium]